MERFLQKNTKKVIVPVQTELCMEDVAKNNIKNALATTGLALGVAMSGIRARNSQENAPPPAQPASVSQEKPKTNEAPPPPKTYDPTEHTKQLLTQQEGREKTWYYDSEGHKTIAIGQRTEMDDFPKVVAACFGQENCEDIVARAKDKSKGWSDEEIDKMFDYSLKNIYAPRAKKLVPALDTFPPDVQAHIISSAYRGSITQSPKTIALLNAGDYKGAAKEYINSGEYTRAKASKSGVAGRMEAVSTAISSLDDYFNPKPKNNETKTTTSAPATTTAPSTTSEPKTQTPDFDEHEVKKGDTLWAISRRTGASVDDISKANQIDPNKLQIGQKLKIPKAKPKAD